MNPQNKKVKNMFWTKNQYLLVILYMKDDERQIHLSTETFVVDSNLRETARLDVMKQLLGPSENYRFYGLCREGLMSKTTIFFFV